MLVQLPEEKKDSIVGLFKNKQPNNSALWCYFEGKIPGRTFVDNVDSPKKAICKLNMSWTYISDDADFNWIEETLGEIIKEDWMQVIWVPSRRPDYPLSGAGKVIPRFEYIERKEPLEQPLNVELSPFTSELFDKLEENFKSWHIQNHGSKEEFLKKSYGFYALENGEICCEAEASFEAKGFCEIGIYTFENHRKKGYAFATCFHMLQELENKGLKTIWACDVENQASVNLAEKLGFVNPVEYDFIYYPHL